MRCGGGWSLPERSVWRRLGGQASSNWQPNRGGDLLKFSPFRPIDKVRYLHRRWNQGVRMVSSIGNSSGASDLAAAQQIRSQMADRMMKAVDTDQNGKITEGELTTAIEASGRRQGLTSSELFQQLDQGGKGYITREDIQSGLERTAPNQSSAVPPPPVQGGGPRGGGGAPPARESESTTSSSTYFYDPEDLNQDGTVSSQEQMQYLLDQYTVQSREAPSLQTFRLDG